MSEEKKAEKKDKQPKRINSKEEDLIDLSRAATECPIYGCRWPFQPMSMLSHHVSRHVTNDNIQMREVFDSSRVMLHFDPSQCELNQNQCLGLILYAGFQNEPNTIPADRNLCLHNAELTREYEHLSKHLPILIMLCKTTWASLLTNKELAKKVEAGIAEDKTKHIYIIWCYSTPKTFALHTTMTVFDKYYTESRSFIRLVRDICQEQDVKKFLPNDRNYILLTNGEVESISHSYKETIRMEIIIHEDVTVNIIPALDAIDLS